MILFLLVHLACLLVLVVAAYGAGAPAVRLLRGEPGLTVFAVRSATGLTTLGLLLFGLGMAGLLTRTASMVLAVAACGAALAFRDDPGFSPKWTRVDIISILVAVAVIVPVFILALSPPSEFDETLYHLPTVEQFARSGSLPFVQYLRAPVFPHLDEVLRVPLFLLAGDVSTHLLSLLATLLSACIVLAWFREKADESTGWVTVALLLSAPIVVHLATNGYVEALMTMFVTAGFYAFDRWRRTDATGWLAASAVFAGSACSVKYLGLFWAGVLFLAVLVRKSASSRLRNAILFAIVAGITLAPWYGRIVYFTGNPLFPFAARIFGHSIWDVIAPAPMEPGERLVAFVRLPWDLVFARDRVGYQPPFSPALVGLVPVLAIHAVRDRLTRQIFLLVAVWGLIWTFLPRDSRFLVACVPLACVASAIAFRDLLRRLGIERRGLVALLALALLALGPLYAARRVYRNGPLAVDARSREAWLLRKVPEWEAIALLNSKAEPDDVAWVCGGEDLVYHFRGEMVGDHHGPARFSRFTSAPDPAELNRRLAEIDARFVLVRKRACRIPVLGSDAASPFFRLLHEDEMTLVYERIAGGEDSRSSQVRR
ncbi:MAG: glycosyltransferase family 39 protein [Thermoanaerobaculia bacterium]|nr:glycosyltransferase family 39 protein [Thermoanaerobaculia bacterium]